MIDLEFFLGNDEGFGYQAHSIALGSTAAFDILAPDATTIIEMNGKTVEVVSPQALLLYYISINKQHRLVDLLKTYERSIPLLLTTSKTLNPAITARLQYALNVYNLTGDIELTARRLMHSEIYNELVLGLAHCTKNIGNLNAGEVIEALGLNVANVSELLQYLENHPLIERAFKESLRYFSDSNSTNQEHRHGNKSYKLLENELIGKLLKIVTVDGDTLKKLLKKIKGTTTRRTTVVPPTVGEATPVDAGYIFFLEQMISVLQRSKTAGLVYHGFHHGLNTGLVSVLLLEKHEVVSERERLNLAVTMLLVGIFHDLAISVTGSYKKHELISSYMLAHFLARISQDLTLTGILTKDLLQKIKVGVVAVFGSQLDINQEIRVNAELTAEQFKQKVLLSVESDLGTVPGRFKTEVSEQEYTRLVTDVFQDPRLSKLLEKLRKLLSIADTSSILSKSCFVGSYELSLEQEVMSGDPLAGLKVAPQLIRSLKNLYINGGFSGIEPLFRKTYADRNAAIYSLISSRLEKAILETAKNSTEDIDEIRKSYVPFVRQMYLYFMGISRYGKKVSSSKATD